MRTTTGPGRRLVVFAGLFLLAFAPAATAAGAPDAPVPALVQKPLGKAQRALIVEALAKAPSHGLPAYDVDARSSDEALARAVVDYAAALRGGRMKGRFDGEWHIRPDPYDAAADFRAVAQSRRKLDKWLDRLAPRHEGYAELREALARYRRIEDSGGWKPLKIKSTLKVGSKGPPVMALRERLGVEYPGPMPEGNPAVFDTALAEALKAEQARLGVPVTGALDKATLAALNVPVSARIDAIEANLERWRWMPASLPGYRLEMNVPAYWLEVHRAGQIPLAMKVVVGRPDTPTPMFIDTLHSLVFNPPWNVPESIARRDILPRAKKDKTYLVKHDYVINADGRLMQLPGPKSALGKIKFDLDNPFAIYFHDTPSRHLFDEPARAFSNGCMRLEKAEALAQLLMEGDRYWHGGGIQKTLVSGETVGAELRRPVPVFVVYRTAFVQDGKVQFRKDVYGWDGKLKEILDF